jgi:predicted pyridoxine 5'-phosphate oxidase superfamily flavin-nucleotide-binding protein
MIALTDDMREAIDTAFDRGLPMVVATASASGVPDLAFKGSFMALDHERLAFWERAHGTTLANLEENPRAAALYRDPKTRVTMRLYGTVELHRGGELRDAIMSRTVQAELDRDPERTGVAVVIVLDRVIYGSPAGRVEMSR